MNLSCYIMMLLHFSVFICLVIGNALRLNRMNLSCYIMMLLHFSVFIKTGHLFNISVLNASTRLKDCLKFTSNLNVHL